MSGVCVCVPSLCVCVPFLRLGLEAKKEENLSDWYTQVGDPGSRGFNVTWECLFLCVCVCVCVCV